METEFEENTADGGQNVPLYEAPRPTVRMKWRLVPGSPLSGPERGLALPLIRATAAIVFLFLLAGAIHPFSGGSDARTAAANRATGIPLVAIPRGLPSAGGRNVVTTRPVTMDELLTGIAVSFPGSQIIAGTNTTVLVPISVGDTTGQGIFSFQGTVTFDQSVITPNATALDVAGTVSSGFSPFANAATPGQLVFGAFGIAELTGSGTLINLRFDTMSNHLDTTNLTFTGFQFNSGTPISKTTNGSMILFNPTGARVTVGGRVTNDSGRGLFNAFVRITTPTGNTRTARTNNFGYYRIPDVEAGDSYLFSVSRKGSVFTPSSTIRTIDGETLDINFRSDN